MTFQQLIKTIDARYSLQILSSENTTPIHDILLLSTDVSDYSDDVLYVGEGSQLNHTISMPTHAILSESSISKDMVDHSINTNLALIPSTEINSLFNHISHILFGNTKTSVLFHQLFNMASEGKSLTEITNAAADILCNPIIIVDTSYKVLTYSSNYFVKDKLWVENIKRGYCTYDFLIMAEELAPKQSAPENSESYDIFCPLSPTSKVGSKIYWNHTLIGYTFLFEEYLPLSPHQKEFLPFVSYIMSEMLSKHPEFEGIYRPFSEKALSNLLIGDNSGYVETMIHYTNLHFPSKMQCLVLEISDNKNIRQQYDSLKDHIQQLFLRSSLTLYHDQIVAVIPVLESEYFSPDQLRSLRKHLESGVSKIMISSVFTDIMTVKSRYEQCIQIAALAKKMHLQSSILYHKDLIFYTLLQAIPDESLLNDKVHPALLVIREYDRSNSGNLYESLQTYINLNCNLKESALALFVHRNSLSYRINKIVELTGLDLTNADTLFHLKFSFCIEKYLCITNESFNNTKTI